LLYNDVMVDYKRP